MCSHDVQDQDAPGRDLAQGAGQRHPPRPRTKPEFSRGSSLRATFPDPSEAVGVEIRSEQVMLLQLVSPGPGALTPAGRQGRG